MNGLSSKRSAAIVPVVLAIAVAVAGCDWDAASAGIEQQRHATRGSEPRMASGERISSDGYAGEGRSLRSRTDAARGRLWVLTSDGVDLYEARTRKKLAHIPLPGWVRADEAYACAPDLALGPKGEALVSSNAVPTLWRIDPDTLAASTHEPVLDDDTGRDIGFTGLAYSPEQGAFFAVSAPHGSLWRIDPLLRRAQAVALSAPDQRSGYVRSGDCSS